MITSLFFILLLVSVAAFDEASDSETNSATTCESLVQHCLRAVKPCFDYGNSLMEENDKVDHDLGGKLWNLHESFKSLSLMMSTITTTTFNLSALSLTDQALYEASHHHQVVQND